LGNGGSKNGRAETQKPSWYVIKTRGSWMKMIQLGYPACRA